MAGLEALSGPPVAPLGLAEAKLHLRVDHDDEDTLIAALLAAAVAAAERYTRRVLLRRSFRLWLDSWPAGRRSIVLPAAPLLAIEEVVLIDGDGIESRFDPAFWLADTVALPGRLVLRAGAPAPPAGREANAIAVRFAAGEGESAAAVPAPLVRGIALLVGQLYENRAAGAPGSAAPLPYGVEALWAPYRLVRL